jgi:hypothetical protein
MMSSRRSDPTTLDLSSPDGGGGGRVIRFRPRGTAPHGAGAWRWEPGDRSALDDLARFENVSEPNDSRRTLVNLVGAGVVIVLMMIAGWVTTTMAAIQSEQECALSDSSHCPPIYVPYIPARERNKPYPFL